MASEEDANTQQNAKEEKPDVQTLQIKVRAQDGSELQFKIKKTTPLIKVFGAYCTKKGLLLQDSRFMIDGSMITSKDHEATPEQMQLEDGDVIDYMAMQVGGSAAACRGLSS